MTPLGGARAALIVAIAVFVTVACTDTVEVGIDVAGGGASVGGASGAAGAGTEAGAGGAAPCTPTTCQGKIYACGNCLDDDGDGLVDAHDAACLGPCDNTEDSYNGGIPGQNNAPCRQDCYFDQDSGSGNDGCEWAHSCDRQSIAPDYPPSGDARCAYDASTDEPGGVCDALRSGQSETCLATCLPLTPNGCDCFGCCELPARSGHYVWLGSSGCDPAHVGDPELCRVCTPVTACMNRCEGCEVCVGTTQMPDNCGGIADCPSGVEACGPDLDCPAFTYCVTGCCVSVPR